MVIKNKNKKRNRRRRKDYCSFSVLGGKKSSNSFTSICFQPLCCSTSGQQPLSLRDKPRRFLRSSSSDKLSLEMEKLYQLSHAMVQTHLWFLPVHKILCFWDWVQVTNTSRRRKSTSHFALSSLEHGLVFFVVLFWFGFWFVCFVLFFN